MPRAPHLDRIDVDGVGIAYERAGTGPPLVLLHGYVGDGPGTWRRQLDDLCDEFTVIAWDAPGTGRSSDPPESFTLAEFADSLAGFVAALELGRPHIAGLSFGGGLALELYRRHPALPRSLVLLSAYAGWAGSLPPAEVARRLQQVLRLADLPPDRFVGEVAPTLFSASAPAEAAAAFAANAAEFHPVGLRAMARSFGEANVRDVLPRIDVPPCCSTAPTTCARRSRWPRTCTPPSPARGWSSCPASVTCASWRRRSG
jgi:pimeloyl-ACP methyl ester carboxylesterase